MRAFSDLPGTHYQAQAPVCARERCKERALNVQGAQEGTVRYRTACLTLRRHARMKKTSGP